MKHFYVQPEVAGGLGAHTALDTSVHPPVVGKLHYEFDGWLGDVLLESFPSFIVTQDAAKKLEAIGATGMRFGDVEITVSDEFRAFYPDRRLPEFVWLRVEGLAGRDDLGTVADGRLVVSDRVLKLLVQLGLAQATVSPFEN
jgi:hypothetical protein